MYHNNRDATPPRDFRQGTTTLLLDTVDSQTSEDACESVEP